MYRIVLDCDGVLTDTAAQTLAMVDKDPYCHTDDGIHFVPSCWNTEEFWAGLVPDPAALSA